MREGVRWVWHTHTLYTCCVSLAPGLFDYDHTTKKVSRSRSRERDKIHTPDSGRGKEIKGRAGAVKKVATKSTLGKAGAGSKGNSHHPGLFRLLFTISLLTSWIYFRVIWLVRDVCSIYFNVSLGYFLFFILVKQLMPILSSKTVVYDIITMSGDVRFKIWQFKVLLQ